MKSRFFLIQKFPALKGREFFLPGLWLFNVPFQEQRKKKEQLKNIVKSLLSGSREHSEDELNAVVYDIYGLTDEEIVVVEATIK